MGPARHHRLIIIHWMLAGAELATETDGAGEQVPPLAALSPAAQ